MKVALSLQPRASCAMYLDQLCVGVSNRVPQQTEFVYVICHVLIQPHLAVIVALSNASAVDRKQSSDQSSWYPTKPLPVVLPSTTSTTAHLSSNSTYTTCLDLVISHRRQRAEVFRPAWMLHSPSSLQLQLHFKLD